MRTRPSYTGVWAGVSNGESLVDFIKDKRKFICMTPQEHSELVQWVMRRERAYKSGTSVSSAIPPVRSPALASKQRKVEVSRTPSDICETKISVVEHKGAFVV